MGDKLLTAFDAKKLSEESFENYKPSLQHIIKNIEEAASLGLRSYKYYLRSFTKHNRFDEGCSIPKDIYLRDSLESLGFNVKKVKSIEGYLPKVLEDDAYLNVWYRCYFLVTW